MNSFQWIVREKQSGQRLDHILKELIDETAPAYGVSKARVRAWIEKGSVYLNGKRVRIASKSLHPSALIQLHLGRDGLLEPSKQTPNFEAFSKSNVIFEDAYFLAIEKPSGIPVQPTLTDAVHHVLEWVKPWVKSAASLTLLHRLDTGTSGVLLLAKTKEAAGVGSQLFANRKIKKEYLAITRIPVAEFKPEIVMKSFLKRSGKKRVSHSSQGDFAETHFKLISKNEKTLSWKAEPITGRTHQIRVHLSDLGMPILGDILYGGDRAARLRLHASRLEFEHPFTQEKITLMSPTPPEFER